MREIFPISTDRLIIRCFRADDAAAFHSWRNDSDVARYTLWEYPYSMAEAKAFCAEQAAFEVFPTGNWCQIMMTDRATGQAVGDIGLGLNVDGDDALEVGYSLHRDHWGKGYMTEALRSVIPAVAKAISACVVKAEVDVRNSASASVLSKLGFSRGPVHKKRSFVKGEWCDEVDYLLSVA